jgi:hypothetical protein
MHPIKFFYPLCPPPPIQPLYFIFHLKPFMSDNFDTKDISGIELGGQHIFGDSGFGVIANATFVFADPEYDYFTPLGEVPSADAVVGASD